MMKPLKSVLTGTLALAITIGGGFAALQVANAATEDSTSSASTTQTEQQQSAPAGKPGRGGKGFHGARGAIAPGGSQELATLLGLTADELAQSLRSGKTLAAIAQEKGVDVQKVIDLLVNTETARLAEKLAAGKLTQAQYDERVAQLADAATKQVNGELAGKGFGLDGRGDGHGKGGLKGLGGADYASLLGMTNEELATAVKSGKTLAAIAQEKSVDVQKLIDLYVTTETAHLERHLADGKLTQAQVDERKAALADKAAKFVNGELTPPAGKGGFKGEGRKGKGMRGSEQTAPTAPASDAAATSTGAGTAV